MINWLKQLFGFGRKPITIDPNDQLKRIMNLGPDWHSEGCAPPNQVAFDSAVKVLALLSGYDLMPSHIDPSTDEGIAIAFTKGDLYADIECYNSGEVLSVTSNGSNKPEVWEVQDLQETILKIKNFIGVK
jgi:hypothetical protein